MQAKSTTSIRTSLKKARGMLDKIEELLEEDRYCIDIAQQVNATAGLLRSINREILISHLNTCGAHKLGSQDKSVRDEFITEVLRVTDVTSRS